MGNFLDKCVLGKSLNAACACPSAADEIAATTGWAIGKICTAGKDGTTTGTFSPHDSIFEVVANWAYNTAGEVWSRPAISADKSTVYVGSDDNDFYALKTAAEVFPRVAWK